MSRNKWAKRRHSCSAVVANCCRTRASKPLMTHLDGKVAPTWLLCMGAVRPVSLKRKGTLLCIF